MVKIRERYLYVARTLSMKGLHKKTSWDTNEKCKVAFDDLPEANKKTMLLVAESVLERIKKEIVDKLLIKCECENGECLNCQRLCEVIDNLL